MVAVWIGALLFQREPGGGEWRDRLLRLLEAHRPFAVRLTVEAGHRPCSGEPPHCDPPLRASDPLFAELAAFALALAAEERGAPSVGSSRQLHLRGLAALIAGSASGEVDAAVRLLREARRRAPEDPAVAADLAAAHLVRAGLRDDLGSRFEALELLDAALHLEPELSAARFNRARLLEQLGLRKEAEAAWLRVLEREGDPGWRGEAQRHRDVLAGPTAAERWEGLVAALEQGEPAELQPVVARMAADHPQQARILVEDVLLPAWGRAVEEERGEARRQREVLRRLVDALGPQGNASILRGTLARLDGAAPGDLPALARSFRLYGEGRAAHERGRYGEAAVHLREAAAILAEHRSPFAVWPRFYLVVESNYADPPDLEATLRGYRALRADPGADPVLLAYVDWMVGYTAMSRGRWAEAVASFEQALERFAVLGESENAAAMESLLAAMWRRIGDVDRALHRHGRALADLHRLHKSRRIQNVLDAVSDLLRDQGRHGLALYFADAWVAEALRSGSPLSRSLALADRGLVLTGLGRMEEALSDADGAVRTLEEIPAAGLRSFTRADVLLAVADVRIGAGDLRGARLALDRVLAFASGEVPRQRVEALERRSAVHRFLGDLGRARADLVAAAQEVAQQRGLLDDEGQRIAYLDRVRRVQERLVSLLVEEGDWEAAFWTADRMRAPEVREALASRGPGAPASPGASWSGVEGNGDRGSGGVPGGVVAELAPGVAVAGYLSLPDRLLVWWWDGEGLRGREILLSRAALERAVASLWDELERGEQGGEAAGWLGERLLPEGLLSGSTDLVVIADGPLHDLPFAALALPTGELVLERVGLVVTPSLEIARHLETSAALAPVPASTLLVTGVAFSADRFPELPRLPEETTTALLPLVDRPRVLEGAEATPARFLREMGRHRTVVFSGHSLAAEAASGRPGGLVLAPGDGRGDGFLPVDQLHGAPPVPTRLVFLASCSGAGGTRTLSEGPLSVVRPFLALGVPTVVATLRPAESRATEDLLLEFFRSGEDDPVRALRHAQLAATGAQATVLAFQVHGSTGGRVRWSSSAGTRATAASTPNDWKGRSE